MQSEKPLPTLHGEGSMHFVLGSPGFTIWTSNDDTECPKMQLPTLEMKFPTPFENMRRCPG